MSNNLNPCVLSANRVDFFFFIIFFFFFINLLPPPQAWSMCTTVIVVIMFVFPTYIAPLFNTITPLEDGDLKDREEGRRGIYINERKKEKKQRKKEKTKHGGCNTQKEEG